MISANPVFQLEMGNSLKFPNVVGDERELQGEGVGGDQQVIRSDRRSVFS